ncbi:MAG: BON domain-containing protein [Bdellovibrionales bacterium]|nr:BON domain-containing protein [Bdellovibrionales bacterium]
MNQKHLLYVIFLALPFQQACVLAAGAAGAEAGYVATQKDRTAGETISDQALVTKVKTKLIADQDVSARRINVDAHKGKVTLSGSLHSEQEIQQAIDLAQSTEGVKEVQSLLTLIPESKQ